MKNNLKPILFLVIGIIAFAVGVPLLSNGSPAGIIFGIILLIAAVSCLVMGFKEVRISHKASGGSSNGGTSHKPIRFGHPKPPSSSTQDEAYWEDQFKRAIKRINNYQAKVVVDVSLPNVNVEITPKVWTGSGKTNDLAEEDKVFNNLSAKVEKAFNNVLSQCPFPATLNVIRK